MPRQARVVLPGYLHHVTQRGNYRQDIFYEDNERVQYLKYIDEYCERYKVDIYAYCLMGNHVHFILKPNSEESLSRAINVAHQRYSYYFHKKRKSQGHLWQARYYSCVLSESHFYKAIRYVECNPVRANIVQRPWDYEWSSARAHMGAKHKLIKLADIREYIDADSWKAYLTEKESEEELRELRINTFQGKVWGSPVFINELEIKFKRNLFVMRRRMLRA